MDDNLTIICIAVAAVVLLLILFSLCYVKTSPDIALVISGWPNRNPKFLVGTGGFRIPGLQKVDKIFLGQLSVDIKAQEIPTNDFINVDVDAIAKVRVNPTKLQEAAANFLGKNAAAISQEVKDTLEGNMREIVGTQELKALNIDRDGFSSQIQEKAATDMAKLGIEILTCNIQNITDRGGLIRDLGADNTYLIKKNASINKANAERDIAIAEAQARKESNDARVASETQIAEKNNELAIKQAELKRQADTQKAVADAAYEIQKQEQLKEVNIKTVEAEAAKEIRMQERKKEINTRAVEAEIEKANKESELREVQVAIQQRMLEAQINKQAEADKFKKETDAAAELEQRKRNAEAEAYEAEQQAKAIKAKAEAELFAAQQEATGIRVKYEAEAAGIAMTGKAEAEAIRAKGEAEAAAMDKKAEAFKKYGQAAMAEMAFKVLPEVAREVAQPLASINDVHVYGTTGSEAAGLSGNVPVVMQQTLETVKSATGVDLGKIMQDNSKVVAAAAEIKK